VASDAADAPNANVGLGGTVLAHAAASLDSTTQDLAGAVDFGSHAPGEFVDQTVRVHNAGWSSLQARLSVSGAAVTGGDGRFTIAGFAPVLLSGTGQSWTLQFDGAGVNVDTTFTATLTFESADEALPGAAAQPDLVVQLQAHVVPTGTDAAGDLPRVTRLLAPFPNPPGEVATLRFDLARPADVRLEVFDVAGRRLATLAERTWPAGAWALRWDGRGQSGQRLGSGVYFIRLSGPEIRTQTVRLTLLR
jgi:hypothetical protein